jgi:hypothetical protein
MSFDVPLPYWSVVADFFELVEPAGSKVLGVRTPLKFSSAGVDWALHPRIGWRSFKSVTFLRRHELH